MNKLLTFARFDIAGIAVMLGLAAAAANGVLSPVSGDKRAGPLGCLLVAGALAAVVARVRPARLQPSTLT